MRTRHWFVLLSLGMFECGATPVEKGRSEVPAQSSLAGVASRVKIVIPPGSGASSNGPYPEFLVGAEGFLYFATNFFDGKAVLWRSDGTEPGTVPVKSFPEVFAAIPRLTDLMPFGDKVFFMLDDPGTTGRELWFSDGTDSGTHLVKDLTPGPGDTWFNLVTRQGGQLTLFREWSPTPDGSQVELWRTDGTSLGTVRFRNFGPPVTLVPSSFEMGGVVNFFLSRPGQGTELWRTDGTANGTVLLKQLGASGTLGGPSLQTEGLFYFVLTSPGHGDTLWRTDGTANGTHALKSLGTTETFRQTLLQVGGLVLFVVTSPAQGTALWRTDGTTAGTSLAKKLDAQVVTFTHWTREGNQALFLFEDGANTEVWKSDGSPAGTVRLDAFGHHVYLLGVAGSKVLVYSPDYTTQRLRIQSLSLSGGGKSSVKTLPNPYANEPSAYPFLAWSTRINGRLYFAAGIGGTGPVAREVSLWVSDGTATGTLLLTNGINPGDEYVPPFFAISEDSILFVASAAATGLELWCTRGTLATTGLLQDLNPGPSGSIPQAFSYFGDRLYFRAFDETRSFQLWSMPAHLTCPTPLAPSP
ncbi:hypothetical protein FOF48_04385 [Corallococcus sp. Z5C101001]|nr:hypothetical protein FOF48_04385 [Corallococcus sp. Z5C101001]